MEGPVSDKQHMYYLLSRGAFGNRFHIWENVDDFERSGFRGLCGVRCSDQPGAPYYHHLTPHQALWTASVFEEAGYHPVIYEASPDQWITFQGEILETEVGLYLVYSRLKTHMRAALAGESIHVFGIVAKDLLREKLSASSYEDLQSIFDNYPSHVVEFTAYEVFVGCLKGRNAVIWEVRNY